MTKCDAKPKRHQDRDRGDRQQRPPCARLGQLTKLETHADLEHQEDQSDLR
jgi:hypothetical protein